MSDRSTRALKLSRKMKLTGNKLKICSQQQVFSPSLMKRLPFRSNARKTTTCRFGCWAVKSLITWKKSLLY